MKIGKKIAMAMTAVMLFTSFSNVTYAKGNDYTILYVSPNGNDSAEGNIDTPLATMEGAKKKLREIKNSQGFKEDGAVVYFRGGNYQLKQSVEFTDLDSGTEEQPILYRAYRDEKVSFFGGIILDGKDFQKTTDSNILNRIVDTGARDKIYEYSLADAGVTEVLERAWRGSYSKSYLDGIVAKFPECDGDYELFIDGDAMEPAKYPNDGFMTVEKVHESCAPRHMTDAEIQTYKNKPANERATMKINLSGDYNERAKKWTNAKDMLMFGYFMEDWADATVLVDTIDANTGTIRSKYPHTYGVKEGARVYVYNLLEEVDAPGEYYVDTVTNTLYIYPPKDITNSDIKMSVLKTPLIKLDKCKYITFKNMDFSVSRTNIFNGDNCENITVDGCELSWTGDKAAYFSSGYKNGFIDCYVHDVNGGVRMVNCGDKTTLTSGECYVENCEFKDFARLTKTYNYAVQFNACVGDKTLYNEIHGATHAGFTSNGNNSLVAFNEAYDLCTETDDAGAFYVGRETLTRGNKFLYNYIHDIGTSLETSMGVRGIYLDDGFSSYDIAGNVFENVAGNAVFIGSGRDNIVYNNIFVNCLKSITGSRYGDLNGILTDIDNTTIHNTDIWKEAYPELYGMKPEDKNTPKGNVFSTNLIYNSAKPDINSTLETLGVVENNYVTKENPGFVDEGNRNYVIKSDSHIYKEIPGFTAVPFTRMGRYSDRAIDRISDSVALCINSPYAFKNGEKVTIDSNENIMSVVYDDRTYLPIRFIAESLGATVDFDDTTGIALISDGENVTEINIRNSTVKVSGESVELETPVKVEHDRTLVPMRAISELLTKKVFWDDIGFVTISDHENLFDSEKDRELIEYLYNKLTLY